jgi:hypothetical protein
LESVATFSRKRRISCLSAARFFRLASALLRVSLTFAPRRFAFVFHPSRDLEILEIFGSFPCIMFGMLIASLSYQKDYRKDNLNATGKNDT